MTYNVMMEDAEYFRRLCAILEPENILCLGQLTYRAIKNSLLDKSKKREIWTAETLMYALSVCEDEVVKLALNLSFAGSLRIGELLGLTRDCIDISEEAMIGNRAYIFINKEVQRVSRASLKALNQRDVILTFPENSISTKTVRVLKSPKTESSIRKVFLPNSVAEDLREWKKQQEDVKEILGPEYQDFNLVMATSFGLPISDCNIRDRMNKLIKEHDLPPVVFHSLRHTSVTYKLKLNGGDIKSVPVISMYSPLSKNSDVRRFCQPILACILASSDNLRCSQTSKRVNFNV